MLPVDSAKFADDVRGLIYSTLAAFVWLCWDVVVHFDKEVECIWLRPSSWVKWTYVLVRYAPLVHEAVVLTLCSSHHFSYAECRGWIYYELIFMQLLTTLVEVILVVRLYVLYSRGWFITIVLSVSFVSETVAMVTTLALVFDRITFLPSCLITDIPYTFAGFWMSSLVFETILFLLTLYKLYESIRGRCRRSIMRVILRDGTWAFSIIFVAMLVNTVMYRFCTTPLIGVGYYWALGVMSFAGSHLLLNLRRLSISENTSTDDIPLDERSTLKTHGHHRTFLTTAIDAPEAYDSLSDTNEDLSEGESPVVRPGDSV